LYTCCNCCNGAKYAKYAVLLLLFECNFSLKTLPELSFLPLFYCSAWKDTIMHTPTTTTTTTTTKQIESEIFWYNYLITIGRTFIFYQWYNAEVRPLSDILDKEYKEV